jgi:diacylglycerol O-acyltransferase / wax synthase
VRFEARLQAVPPQHLDRLSAVDASFLHQEQDASHMHVGAGMIFEGPPPTLDEFLEHLESRLHLVPRYRQKLAFPPLQTGRPFWVDDPNFHLEYHVRHTALPHPGGLEQLRLLASRIFSQRLDRSKPLWEMWLVQGLTRNRFALITKTHHAMIDGISGVDLASVLFDLDPVPTKLEPEPWTPAPAPTDAQLLAEGVKDVAGLPVHLAGRALGALRSPRRAVDEAVGALEGIGEVAWANIDTAPETPLNVPIGSHRRFIRVHSELPDFKAVKNALGGTVNDVVLTVVTGAVRRWLRSRGVRTEGLALRALVPVSIRAEDERGQTGNRIAAMRGPLPVYCDDVVECLEIVREEMRDLKESKQALGAEVIAGLQDFAPPTLLAQASRLNFSTRLFNLIVTNVPGPQFPLYFLGRELQQLIPVAFLPEDHAMAVAIMSYNGQLAFGLLGDYDAMPDMDFVQSAIEETIAELLAAARAAKSPGPGGDGDGASTRVRTSRPRSSRRASTAG